MLKVTVVNSQQRSCAACNCQLNNVEILQLLVENIVNQSLDARVSDAVDQAVDTTLQSVRVFQQQVNATIDERIANSQRDVPGKVYSMHGIQANLEPHCMSI